jgi:hypothetical protein
MANADNMSIMNRDFCIELRISKEDISSEYSNASYHKQHKHRHHHEPKLFDSSNWTEEVKHHPGLGTSQVAPVNEAKSLMTTDISSQGLSLSINGKSYRASTIEERRNPFASREGSIFIWQNVNMTLVRYQL